jgi:hypothetical protein
MEDLHQVNPISRLARLIPLSVVACLGIAASSQAVAQSKAGSVDIAQAEEDQGFALGVEAYVWGYPLAITASTALGVTDTDKPLPNAHAPFNTFGHVSKLFTAADKDVVSSNVDTVYSSAFVDLKQGAARLAVPDSGDRYYSMMLEDAYTNVFGYVGQRATGTKAAYYLITGPGWNGKAPPGIAKVIPSPTSLVWIIGRTLVSDQADLANVRVQQSEYKLEMIPPALTVTPAIARWRLPGAISKVPSETIENLGWHDFYQWIGQLMEDNPPPKADEAFTLQLKNIGLTSEKGFDPSGLSVTTLKGMERGYDAGKRIVKREALKSGAKVVNGWAYNLEQGRWGQNYNLRAAIAYRSLGQNLPEEALYFNTRIGSDDKPLNGANKYAIRFDKGQLPPVDGFWSITMYNAENFFVDNPINRYAIGNRSEGFKPSADGALTLLVQRDAPADSDFSHWLPAPEGDFRLSLRLYVPKPAVLDGAWSPPPVRAVH